MAHVGGILKHRKRKSHEYSKFLELCRVKNDNGEGAIHWYESHDLKSNFMINNSKPLFLAVCEITENEEIINYLIDHYDLNSDGDTDNSNSNRREIDPLTLKTQHGKTCLHIACESGCLPALKALIKSNKLNYNDYMNLCMNGEGWTSLMSAVKNNHIDLCLYLLHNCNVNVQKEKNLGSMFVNDWGGPLHWACLYGSKRLVSELLRREARVNEYSLDGPPIHWVCRGIMKRESENNNIHDVIQDHNTVSNATDEGIEIISLLLQAGADPQLDYLNRRGETLVEIIGIERIKRYGLYFEKAVIVQAESYTEVLNESIEVDTNLHANVKEVKSFFPEFGSSPQHSNPSPQLTQSQQKAQQEQEQPSLIHYQNQTHNYSLRSCSDSASGGSVGKVGSSKSQSQILLPAQVTLISRFPSQSQSSLSLPQVSKVRDTKETIKIQRQASDCVSCKASALPHLVSSPYSTTSISTYNSTRILKHNALDVGMDIDGDYNNQVETEPRLHAALSKKFEFYARRSPGKNKRRISSNNNPLDLDDTDKYIEREDLFHNIQNYRNMKETNHSSHGSIASRITPNSIGTSSQSGGSGDTLYEDVVLSLRHDKDFMKNQTFSTMQQKNHQNPFRSPGSVRGTVVGWGVNNTSKDIHTMEDEYADEINHNLDASSKKVENVEPNTIASYITSTIRKLLSTTSFNSGLVSDEELKTAYTNGYISDLNHIQNTESSVQTSSSSSNSVMGEVSYLTGPDSDDELDINDDGHLHIPSQSTDVSHSESRFVKRLRVKSDERDVHSNLTNIRGQVSLAPNVGQKEGFSLRRTPSYQEVVSAADSFAADIDAAMQNMFI